MKIAIGSDKSGFAVKEAVKAYLAGTDVAGASGNETDRLVVGLDRAGRRRHVLWSAIILPGVVFLLLAGEAFRRRRRT